MSERASRLAGWGILVAAAFLPASIVGAQWGGGIAGIGILAAFALGRRSLLPVGLGLPVAAFVVAVTLATALSPADPGVQGFLGLRHVVFLVLVPAAASLAPDPDRLVRRALTVFLCSGAMLALLGIVQPWTGFDLNHAMGVRREALRVAAPGTSGWAAIGTFNSRLTYSAVQSAVALAALAVALGWRGVTFRVLGAATAVASTVAVVLTYSRAAWIGLAVGVVALAVGLRRKAAIAVVALAVVGTGVAVLVPAVKERALSAVRTTANPDRLFIWSRAGEVLADHPVHGTGVGAYAKIAGPYYDRYDPLFPMRTWAHDTFFSILLESGVAGLITLAWMLLAAAALAVRSLWRGLLEPRRSAALGGLAASVAVLVYGLFHDVLYDGEAAMTLFFLLGLAASAAVEREVPAPTMPGTPTRQ